MNALRRYVTVRTYDTARYRAVQARTLGHADLINTSLALFIKDLFAVVHPAHAARLCGAYIRALRSREEESLFLVSHRK